MAAEMHAAIELPPASVILPPLPDRLVDAVALDMVSGKVHVDRRRSGDPLLLTWMDRCRAAGVRLQMVVTDLDEVATLRARGLRMSGGAKDNDLQVRAMALSLLANAARYKVSDLHMLMRGTHAEIQVRRKGDLKVLARVGQREAEEMARALYQGVATVKDSSFNPLEFQNAQISGDAVADMELTSVRLVRGPAFPVETGGGFVVMRLQYTDAHEGRTDLPTLESPRRPEGELRLPAMGYTPLQVALLMFLAETPNGVIAFTGPTGSGKTTSLAQMLAHVARQWPEKRQVTIEDPVEYPLPWAVQMVINNAGTEEETGDAFAEKLRTALRMDPDIILMGELRGPDSAVAALNAALTGHQVWTTLHVTDPFLSVERLEMMDPQRLHRRVFCDHKIVRGLIAQRIVPQLCPHCSVPLSEHLAEIPDRLLSALKTYGDISAVRLKGPGCARCGGDGIAGRMAVAEVVVTDARLMRDFIDHGTDVARRNHRQREDTDLSLMENAVMRVLDGSVDPRHVGQYVDVVVPKGEEDR
jgi:type II secretory ATPase GspE/PulE/Tfp pilus assembly ATPase PilB-like protein